MEERYQDKLKKEKYFKNTIYILASTKTEDKWGKY